MPPVLLYYRCRGSATRGCSLNIDVATSAIVIFVVKEIYSFLSNKNQKLEESIRELTSTIMQLENNLEFVSKSLEELPKMRADISEAHSRIAKIHEKLIS